MSREYEKGMGEATNKAMLQKFSGKILSPTHATAKLLRKVGTKLIKAAGPEATAFKNLPWEFHVIDDDSIMNACAMPGGKVLLFTGLKQCVGTEEELASVIGHEISHVLLRHSAEAMAKQNILSGVFVAMAALGIPVNYFTFILGDLTISKPNSRMHEKEADAVGVLLCARAGYNPLASVRVFERMEEIEAKSHGTPMPGAKFLSTHPAYPERIRDLRQEAERVRPIYEETKAAAWMSSTYGA